MSKRVRPEVDVHAPGQRRAPQLEVGANLSAQALSDDIDAELEADADANVCARREVERLVVDEIVNKCVKQCAHGPCREEHMQPAAVHAPPGRVTEVRLARDALLRVEVPADTMVRWVWVARRHGEDRVVANERRVGCGAANQ